MTPCCPQLVCTSPLAPCLLLTWMTLVWACVSLLTRMFIHGGMCPLHTLFILGSCTVPDACALLVCKAGFREPISTVLTTRAGQSNIDMGAQETKLTARAGMQASLRGAGPGLDDRPRRARGILMPTMPTVILTRAGSVNRAAGISTAHVQADLKPIHRAALGCSAALAALLQATSCFALEAVEVEALFTRSCAGTCSCAGNVTRYAPAPHVCSPVRRRGMFRYDFRDSCISNPYFFA
jgi:hypothetical protein